jgi:hypothetical protein
MKRYWIIPFVCMAMLCIGCAGSKKMRMPLAEIDRSIVNPKGTWSVAPSIAAYISTSDTVTYRGIDYYRLLEPPVYYSFTNNLQLHSYPFFSPTLVWQLTKSPYVDTSARYKWQVALAAGTNWFGLHNLAGNVGLHWKKRLSPSVWYAGNMVGYWAKDSGKRILVPGGNTSNGIGFQLSPKASVATGLGLFYAGDYHFLIINDIGYSGNFNFQYAFSPWFSLNVDSGITGYRKVIGMNVGIGSEFFW